MGRSAGRTSGWTHQSRPSRAVTSRCGTRATRAGARGCWSGVVELAGARSCFATALSARSRWAGSVESREERRRPRRGGAGKRRPLHVARWMLPGGGPTHLEDHTRVAPTARALRATRAEPAASSSVSSPRPVAASSRSSAPAPSAERAPVTQPWAPLPTLKRPTPPASRPVTASSSSSASRARSSSSASQSSTRSPSSTRSRSAGLHRQTRPCVPSPYPSSALVLPLLVRLADLSSLTLAAPLRPRRPRERGPRPHPRQAPHQRQARLGVLGPGRHVRRPARQGQERRRPPSLGPSSAPSPSRARSSHLMLTLGTRCPQEPFASDPSCSWKFTVSGHLRTIPLPQQIATVNTFAFMPFKGPIKLRNPDLDVGVFEEYEWDPLRGQKVREARVARGLSEEKGKGKEKMKVVEEGDPEDTGGLRGVWMGRKVRPLSLSPSLPDSFSLSTSLTRASSCRSATRRGTSWTRTTSRSAPTSARPRWRPRCRSSWPTRPSPARASTSTTRSVRPSSSLSLHTRAQILTSSMRNSRDGLDAPHERRVRRHDVRERHRRAAAARQEYVPLPLAL